MDSSENRNYEQEIDLKDLMFSVLRKWRPVIIIAVLFAVLLGSYKLVKGMGQLGDPQFMKENEEAYRTSMEQYEDVKEHYSTEIGNIQKELKQQQKYKEESILMNINPYDVHVASTTLYIATDYQIMPEMAYQNPNTTASIRQAYMSIIQNCELYNDAEEIMEDGRNIRYLKELVRIEPGYSSNYIGVDNYVYNYNNKVYNDSDDMFTITVTGDTEEQARDVMNWVMDCVYDSHDMVEQTVGVHQVNVVNSSEYAGVDLDLDNDQKNFTKIVGELDKALTETNKSMGEIKAPSVSQISRSSVLKGSVKYGVLGGVLGGFVSVFFICVTFLMSDKLVNEKELRHRYGIRVLGTFKKTGTKKAFAFVDRWLDRLEGASERELEDRETLDVIAANVMNHAGDARNILLTGTVDGTDLERILNGLNDLLPGLSVSAGENPCKDARTIREAASCDAVIIVERRNSSSFSSIEREIDFIKGLDKKVLGYVVI